MERSTFKETEKVFDLISSLETLNTMEGLYNEKFNKLSNLFERDRNESTYFNELKELLQLAEATSFYKGVLAGTKLSNIINGYNIKNNSIKKGVTRSRKYRSSAKHHKKTSLHARRNII